MAKHQTRLQKEDAGSAQVEFAFSILFMVVTLLTLMELCNAIYTFVVLSDAANEGVRYAIVHSADSNFSSDVQTKVWTYAGAAFSINNPTQNVNVSVSCPDTGGCAVPNRVEVNVSYSYVPLITFFRSATSPTMTAYAEGRLVN
jgi:Flp pilus assembly protein TadG